MTLSKRLLRISFPLVMLIASAFLWTHVTMNSALLDVPSAVGPGGWPRAMLAGLAAFSFLLLLSEFNEWRLNREVENGEARESNGSTVLALVGVAVILGYGFSIPYIGFALATFLFIATWCVLGRIRPLTILLVSGIGTVVLLYMFVALAKMPLNRGTGVFNELSIALYQALGIY